MRQDNRKQHRKWRCTNCSAVSKIRAIALAITVIFALSMGTAYAEQQATVTLPLERPYESVNCSMFASGDSSVTYLCSWNWKVDPAVWELLVPVKDESYDYNIWLDEILPIAENNPFQEPEDTQDSYIVEDETPTTPDPFELLDPELQAAIKSLGECRFGLEGWASFQAQINFTIPDQLPIFTSGLDKDQVKNRLAKAFEACRIQQDYPLSAQWLNVYEADIFGMQEEAERPGSVLDERRLYEEQRLATPEDIKAEADRVTYPDWYVNPYEELTGINRGNPIPIVDELLYNEYLTAQAARDLNERDTERVYEEALKIQCQVYVERYEYKIMTYIENGETITDYSNFPQWLMHCID